MTPCTALFLRTIKVDASGWHILNLMSRTFSRRSLRSLGVWNTCALIYHLKTKSTGSMSGERDNHSRGSPKTHNMSIGHVQLRAVPEHSCGTHYTPEHSCGTHYTPEHSCGTHYTPEHSCGTHYTPEQHSIVH